MKVTYGGGLFSVLREIDEFGFKTVDLVGPPRRLIAGVLQTPLHETGVDRRRVTPVPSPMDWAHTPAPVGISQTTSALSALSAGFLVSEDPHRRLEVVPAAPLMHQASLVKHILEEENLRKVLIADEVGLGKTIEAGLIVKRLITDRPGTRVLYLAPARLVKNVGREFREKLDINARLWIAGAAGDARLEGDQVVIASIQKAVFAGNFETVLNSGPWDVLIVDECHHLSHWGLQGGGANRGYRLVRDLAAKLPADGRLILLSGTPHQGNQERFDGLLRLLSDDGKTIGQARGRVIFRTKEKVRDWHGAPLFPKREVRTPVVVQLGAEYEDWYRGIAQLYSRPSSSETAARAAAWAKGQALQWAASSIHAGLGFLVRLGIRRLDWKPGQPALDAALSALRPYRGGPANESVRDLYQRIVRQHRMIAQAGPDGEAEFDDIETEEDETWRPDPGFLSELVMTGCHLLKTDVSRFKWEQVAQLIDQAENEKVVLFAQPVETVTAVADFLKKRYGGEVSLIHGSQSEDERNASVADFVSADGPRFLVSSRAGGEGLNMQAARRIIHLDIPWNPMDMEQRIGRVHRFGSRRKILVDTVVAAGSREVDMYRVAREKLRLVASQMGAEEFDALFGRVMSLVPPEELEHILGSGAAGPLSDDASSRIAQLVSEGFRAWRSFEDSFKQQADAIAALNPGQANWEDLAAFLERFCSAKEGAQVKLTRFRHSGDEVDVEEHHDAAIVINGESFYCGEGTALPPEVDGKPVPRIGINTPHVNERLRSAFCNTEYASVGVLRREGLPGELVGHGPEPALFAVYLRQSILSERGASAELDVGFRIATLHQDGSYSPLDPVAAANLARQSLRAVRVKEWAPSVDLNSTASAIRSFERDMQRIDDEDIRLGRRYALWPLALLVFV